MFKKITIENSKGKSVNLIDRENYIVTDIQGLDYPESAVTTQANGAKSGVSITNQKVESRQIDISVKLLGNIEKSRINLYSVLPHMQDVTFYYKNEHRDVYIDGTIEKLDCQTFVQDEVATITILCPIPTFNDVEEREVSFAEEADYFEFPFAIEEEGIPFSYLNRSDRILITNEGDATAGLMVYMYATDGEVVNPGIVNVTTGERMDLSITLEDTSTLIVSTGDGQKSVTYYYNGKSTDALSNFNYNANWLQLEPGDNVFAFTADSGVEYLTVGIKYAVNYYGV